MTLYGKFRRGGPRKGGHVCVCLLCVGGGGRGGLGYGIGTRASVHHAMVEAWHGIECGVWGAHAKFGSLGAWGWGSTQLSQSASLTGKGSNSVSFNRSDTNQVCLYPISGARNTILPKSEAKQKSLPTVLGCEVVRIATSLLPIPDIPTDRTRISPRIPACPQTTLDP